MSIILDSQIIRSNVFLKPYQVKILRILWKSREHLSPREIWLKVNMEAAEAVSRPKVINFLEAGVDNGILDFTEDTDNGIRYYLNGCMT